MKRLPLFAIPLLLAGCDDREIEAMRRVGDTALHKMAGLAASAQARVQLPVPAVPPTAEIRGDSPLERVRRRLEWDRDLQGCNFTLRQEGERIVLAGSVATEEQRQRALALAQSTLGVAEVNDQLSVARR